MSEQQTLVYFALYNAIVDPDPREKLLLIRSSFFLRPSVRSAYLLTAAAADT
jgi:hypothetical protein